MVKQIPLFEMQKPKTQIQDLLNPKGYTGFARFHKYWGKKPAEALAFIIENLSEESDIVLDPFMGFGLIARIAISRDRRFIGLDINPISIDLASLLLNLPTEKEFKQGLRILEREVKDDILNSYRMSNGEVATHHVWNDSELEILWKSQRGKKRNERQPSVHDIQMAAQYEGYELKYGRRMNSFDNSRINCNGELDLTDLFTGRALRNIDLLFEGINKLPEDLKHTFRLCVTAAAGQMSKMVFVISREAERDGKVVEKIGIGSWVIGYWRPQRHFEINVWRCFENKVRKLLKAIKEWESVELTRTSSDFEELVKGEVQAVLNNVDAYTYLKKIPDNSISLIVTDPPHGDRIPYLELSEMWNALLDNKVDFDNEIVISDASDREKDVKEYQIDLNSLLTETTRVLKPGGYLALMFNSREDYVWEALRSLISTKVEYCGCYPSAYSAGSVVQDNRKGSLKEDYVLIYRKAGKNEDVNKLDALRRIPEWREEFPGN